MTLPGFEPAEIEAAANLFKQLSHPGRLCILAHLVAGPSGVSEMEALLCIRQPALSQQLAALRQAGLIEASRSGREVVYRLVEPRIQSLLYCLAGLPQPSPKPVRRTNGHDQAAMFGRVTG